MTIEEAYEVLCELQAWRRSEGKYAFSETPSENEQLPYSSKEVGIALDVAIETLKKEVELEAINKMPTEEETKSSPLCERGATDDEVYNRKAEWCSVCDRADCPLHGHDNLVICKHFHESKGGNE